MGCGIESKKKTPSQYRNLVAILGANEGKTARSALEIGGNAAHSAEWSPRFLISLRARTTDILKPVFRRQRSSVCIGFTYGQACEIGRWSALQERVPGA